MYELKTKPNNNSVDDFLASIKQEKKRIDAFKILDIMRDTSGQEPKMWGDSIVGFGSYEYKYKSGHGGRFFVVGFSPRVQKFSIYLPLSCMQISSELLEKLGKYKTSVSCMYINKIDDINIDVFKKIIKLSVEDIKNRYEG